MMRSVIISAVVLFLAVCGTAQAEPLTIDLADNHVKITTGFTGADLVLFGDKIGRGDVFVVLEGPMRKSRVWRKEQVLGAWINKGGMNFESIPSYYDYAVSVEDESDLLPAELLKEERIGMVGLRFDPEGSKHKAEAVKDFQDALLRNKQAQRLFPLKAASVKFISDHLFRVDFHLPSNVPSGEYNVRAMLVRGGRVVAEQSRPLRVGYEGFNAKIYKFSQNSSFLYGLVCVFIALVAGWLSNTIVRRN